MTSIQQLLNIVAGLLAIISYVPYIIAILRKETKPSKATWIIWMSLANLTAAGMYADGALNAQIAVTALGDILVVSLALRYGAPGWSTLDKVCLAGAILGIGTWAWTRNPLHAVLIALIVTSIGAIPTIVKTWEFPDQEDKTAYSLMVGSCIAQIAAIPAWTIINALQPIVFASISGTILFLIFTRRKKVIVM